MGSVLHELVELDSPLESIVSEPSYDTLNARVTYYNDAGDWELSVWGRNITDECYKNFRRANPIIRVFGLDASGAGLAFPGATTTQAIGAIPATYGVSFRKFFQ